VFNHMLGEHEVETAVLQAERLRRIQVQERLRGQGSNQRSASLQEHCAHIQYGVLVFWRSRDRSRLEACHGGQTRVLIATQCANLH
jgi:hypothetical protein